jgi:BirA family biotin operon repressor/biotin-[acetyl-CoA-carboxylase] ligase
LSTDPGWPEGYDLHVLSEVDSTNAEAARIATGLTQPTWILAYRQSAARGRRGRAWEMAPGNFAATLVLRPDGPVAAAAQRSFTAALALADALSGIAGPSVSVTLKWPNDVLLDGGKVAGILLEGAGDASGLGHLAIGIGVNLVAAPALDAIEPGAQAPVSLAGVTGVTVAPEAFLRPLAMSFEKWDRALTTFGFGPIRAAWLSRAARLGQTVTARTLTETVTGRFDTLSPDGALILTTREGPRTIPAADVYF